MDKTDRRRALLFGIAGLVLMGLQDWPVLEEKGLMPFLVPLLVWSSGAALLGYSVFQNLKHAKWHDERSADFYNREYSHKTAMEAAARKLNEELTQSNAKAKATEALATALQEKVDNWVYKYNQDLSKQNDDYCKLRDSLMTELADARMGTAPCRNIDTEVILECVMMGADGMRPTDITSPVRSKFLSQGKPIPVQWQDYLLEDPSPRKTKFVTATFSITKRETNFINCLVEPPLTASAMGMRVGLPDRE